MNDEISLTPREAMTAALHGAIRQIEGIFKNKCPAYGVSNHLGWQIHIEGAAGELAFAKFLDHFWCGQAYDRQAKDVGNWQVRTSLHQNAHLILHEEDNDDDPFVLLTGICPNFTIRGWILGREGKRPEYWQDKGSNGRPAFFVPQSALKRILKFH